MTHSIDAPLPPPATTGAGATSPRSRRRAATGDQGRRHGRGQERRPDRRAGRQPGRLDRDRPGQGGRPGDPAPGQGPARPGPHAGQGPGRHPAAEGRSGPDLASRRSCAASPTAPARVPPARPRDLLQQASGMVESFADKLQNREPAELLDEVRSFARRKPGLFLLGAAAAGVARRPADQRRQGRPQRLGALAAARAATAATNYVDPAPTYSDYAGHRPASAYAGTGADRHRHRLAPRCRRRRTAPCRPRAASCRRPPRPAGTTRRGVPVGWADR